MPAVPVPAARPRTYLHGSLRLHYETAGSQGTPVVLLHGMGCNLGLMQGCMEPAFAAAKDGTGWQRLYIDLPGMGASNAPLELASSDAVLGELAGFVRAVVGERRFALAGQSYGGYLARGLAALFGDQVAGILLLCPLVEVPARPLPSGRTYRSVDRAYVDALPDGQRASFMCNAVVADEATHRRFLAELAPGYAQADLPFVETLRKELAFGPENLRRIASNAPACPALVVCGLQDATVGFDAAFDLARSWPRATFALLDGAGHNLQIERPAAFEALVCDWLARVEEGLRAGPTTSGITTL